ncbi:MAG: hypothetical protein U0075_17130 [Thermomicrobiales bacterium]
MNRIDDSPEWSAEGLGIAIRMQHGDFGRESRTPFYLRLAAVVLSVTTLAILLGVGGWYAWRSLARRTAEDASASGTPDAAARG